MNYKDQEIEHLQAKVECLQGKLAALAEVVNFADCPECGGIIVEPNPCHRCGFLPNVPDGSMSRWMQGIIDDWDLECRK